MPARIKQGHPRFGLINNSMKELVTHAGQDGLDKPTAYRTPR